MRRARLEPELGGIVLGWLTKLVLTLFLLGLVAFDGISITVAHVGAIDDANSAAYAASAAWASGHHDMNAAYRAAVDSATQHGEVIVEGSLHIDSDGTAHLRLERTATTVIVRHIGPLKKLATVEADGDAKYLG